ncbi:MAG TPA: hypothetical protein VKE42_13200 [Candidatus Cybelea sp.]|nr:hypothetical protein [Candidatus Cybelea sp.]
MLQLSSLTDVMTNIQGAKNVVVEAYTLRRTLVEALEDAAQHGSHVCVELERRPYGSKKGGLAEVNRRLAAQLRASGARVCLSHPIHAKTIAVDGTLYLDEKNWNGNDIIVREADRAAAGAIPMKKSDALAEEARLLATAQKSDRAIVESESFGDGNATYFALRALARRGAAPRLLVSDADLRGNSRELTALQNLAADGVRVRVCKDTAKLAVRGDAAWLGSANATYADGNWAMPDWGLCTGNPAIVDTVRTRLESEWRSAREL